MKTGDSVISNSAGYNVHHEHNVAQPLHLQRLEASLNIEPFMAYAQDILSHSLTSSEDSDSDMNTDCLAPDEKVSNGIATSKCGKHNPNADFFHSNKFKNNCFLFRFIDRQNDKLQIYNLSQIGPDRKWLQDVLLSDTETDPELSDEDDYIREMLKEHVKEKKIRAKYYQNPHVSLSSFNIPAVWPKIDFKMIFLNRIPNMDITERVSYRMLICIMNINVK